MLTGFVRHFMRYTTPMTATAAQKGETSAMVYYSGLGDDDDGAWWCQRGGSSGQRQATPGLYTAMCCIFSTTATLMSSLRKGCMRMIQGISGSPRNGYYSPMLHVGARYSERTAFRLGAAIPRTRSCDVFQRAPEPPLVLSR